MVIILCNRNSKHFVGNENFDKKNTDTENFIYNFLTGTEEHQKRVLKFQESILKKTIMIKSNRTNTNH